METLCADQQVLHGRMARTVDNVRKLGKAKVTKAIIEVQLRNLDARWKEFQDNDVSIRHAATEDDRKGDYFSLDIFGAGEEAYCLQRGELMEWFEDLDSSRKSMTGDVSIPNPCSPAEVRQIGGANGDDIATPANTSPIQVHVSQSTLPQADLPTFTGIYHEWIRYRDLFTTLVLENNSWSDAERFHYLTASLSGEAAQLIQRVPISGRNFPRAWELLEHRYENRRLLVDAQFELLFSMTECRTHTAGELTRILNCMCNVSSNLNSLDIPVDDTSFWMVQYVVRILDDHTLKHWERSLGSRTDPPAFSELLEFLEKTVRTLEAIETRAGTRRSAPRVTTTKVKTHHTSTDTDVVQKRTACSLCQGRHPIYFCQAYKGKSPQERLKWVKSSALCQNCLGRHETNACRTTHTCHQCAQPHHTTLHDAIRGTGSTKVNSMVTSNGSERQNDPAAVILATALISVGAHGRVRTVRALIDPCSEVTLVSESLVQTLRASRKSCSHVVVGAGANPTATVRGKATLTIAPRDQSSICRTVEALILPRLTHYRPPGHHGSHTWPHIAGLKLADPDTTSTQPIELLLGADVYPTIILDGIRRGGRRMPIAQETIFGWILSGPTTRSGSSSSTAFTHACTIVDLTSLIQRFWEQEEVSTSDTPMSSEEAACDSMFASTHTREDDGRYVVRLCLNNHSQVLGETHGAARKILLANERRLHGNHLLRMAYNQFMADYRDLGHMQPVPEEDWVTQRPHFYLPHHGVMKVTDSSTKLRVVFNGSKKSSIGTSLNDHLSAGPKLQLNLMDVLLRWRRHRVAFIADIEKMYRQIKIHRDDWDYQRILWRDSPDQPIIPHHLTTVTYGLTCAPYLAIRTLLQLAKDEGARFPIGATLLQESTYVDDILSGADTTYEALQVQKSIIGLCRAGGFTLKKWNANRSALLSKLPSDSLATSSSLPWHPELGCSALGLTWHPDTDDLSFSVKPPSSFPILTKRHVLSQIAKLFDPLGWLAPFVIRGKILMQQLWKEQLGWDDVLPPLATEQWKDIITEMPTLAEIRVPRWIGVTSEQSSSHLHIFVDASQKAFAAVAYLRIEDTTNTASASLLVAKSKTAPLKVVSLPRLELCAAVLGARLLSHIRREQRITVDEVHLWSDSTVALAWLRGEPFRWNTYVANRVSEFQTTVPDVRLHHVGTKDNPADCASRGTSSAQLRDHPLWWHGPGWLISPPCTWDSALPAFITTEEEKATAASLHTSIPVAPPLLLRYSSFDRLLRIAAWCLRWRNTSRRGSQSLELRPDELRQAELRVIQLAQRCDYSDVITAVSTGGTVGRSSPLRAMAPFLDDQGVLRVGGRLKHSLLSFDEQHPIILAPESPLTRLVIGHHHRRTLHGGVQLTLASIRQRFWVPQGRRMVKQCISRCIVCLRWRAATKKQMMGDLPSTRVTPTRPFLHTGVDYAGPMLIRTTAGRGHKATKGYVAIFVCFSTRAVHIEAVSDYSTPAFLAAFRRFSGRRGLCSTLSSDCGTNFVGADQELRRLFTASSKEAAAISHHMSNNGVQWKFIPPAAPHFGGLWEAAVRSVKHHLRRVIGDATLTFEELTTVLCQVEACLNSRPLQALTDDPEDLSPLTPGHFLIGEPLLAVPEPTLQDVPTHRLSRWQQQQQRVEHFWRRWSSEYLHQLQTRKKWTTRHPSLTIGELVLLKSELTPPCKWPLARVTEVHPGSDGLIRVVT
ncbi:uncharacterized protein LOC143220345, partial [Lasioglossum baleicum]|uniref:uncharacterized protein LOC143220345 n=1 Tax=Lasioglossum baleicum TaxID=434251 RepID=UPI003FCEA841